MLIPESDNSNFHLITNESVLSYTRERARASRSECLSGDGDACRKYLVGPRLIIIPAASHPPALGPLTGDIHSMASKSVSVKRASPAAGRARRGAAIVIIFNKGRDRGASIDSQQLQRPAVHRVRYLQRVRRDENCI
ncbi:hypothetical protein EVAR_28841_1 [Eumeta japonica]|uniref:Uncharacterized protein n=1 Tax=Eumeta variegata TaxID=151549 RepID=A0A4C1WK01_EUMVA|nr:hypothetical protein EVAR_28841_1 [Eumeta japonica]